MSRFHPLTIAAITPETRDAVVVTFDIPDPLREAFRFSPGQHLTLKTPVNGVEIRRSYSICSAPDEGHLRIAIKRVPDGLFSNWAHRELHPGHTLEVMEPSGAFSIPPCPAIPPQPRHHVAFAAGSGITPILSILKTVLATEPQSRVTLIYGNRASSTVLFKEDLENLKDRYLSRFNLIFILSREHQDLDLFNGRIDRAKTDALLAHWIDPTDIDVAYLCGPQSMMQAVSESLQSHGVPKDRIRQELFGTATPSTPRPQAPAQTAQDCHVSLTLDGRERHFNMQRDDKTLLDAALDQGIDLPYSCKGGVCSTCRCKLTRGEVDMDVHFALEDYEIARGFILACQSYPLTPEITLNFDTES